MRRHRQDGGRPRALAATAVTVTGLFPPVRGRVPLCRPALRPPSCQRAPAACRKPSPQPVSKPVIAAVERADPHADGAITPELCPEAKTFLAIRRPFAHAADGRRAVTTFLRTTERKRPRRTGIGTSRAALAIVVQTNAARRVCSKRQRSKDLGKSDTRTVFRGQNQLVAAIFAKAGLNRIGHRERRIIIEATASYPRCRI